MARAAKGLSPLVWDAALADVMEAAPQTIIYMSCSPKTFARDLAHLDSQYEVQEVRAFGESSKPDNTENITL